MSKKKKKEEEKLEVVRIVMNKKDEEYVLPLTSVMGVLEDSIVEEKDKVVRMKKLIGGDITVHTFGVKKMKDLINEIDINEIKYIVIEEAILEDGSSNLEDVINLPKENRYKKEIGTEVLFHFGKEE